MFKGTGSEYRRAACSHAVATLNPGYFALVMSTGIISVGMRNHNLMTLSYLARDGVSQGVNGRFY
jgi:hypothetical protein